MVHTTKANSHATDRPGRNRRRTDRGLTTLEWLLIVAAVAGLAALAVVLVQNVVDETAEQIAGNSARLTAAQVAAAAITNSDDTDAEKKAACNRLEITYSDVLDAENQTAHWGDADADAESADSTEAACVIQHDYASLGEDDCKAIEDEKVKDEENVEKTVKWKSTSGPCEAT